MPTAGYKILTRQKRTVREVVKTMPNPFTAKEVCDSLSRVRPRVSRATVYRVLTLLCEEGVLREFWLPNGRRVCVHEPDRVLQIVECVDCGQLQCAPVPAAIQKLLAGDALEGILHLKKKCPARRKGCEHRSVAAPAGAPKAGVEPLRKRTRAASSASGKS